MTLEELFTSCEHGIHYHGVGVPAGSGDRWIPSFADWIAFDPGEERVQPHGNIHDGDDEPNEHFGVACGNSEESDSERRLAQHGGEYREGGRNVAKEADLCEVGRVDVDQVLADAEGDHRAVGTNGDDEEDLVVGSLLAACVGVDSEEGV